MFKINSNDWTCISEVSLRCVVANLLDTEIVVSEFEFQLCYYVHFGLILLGKV